MPSCGQGYACCVFHNLMSQKYLSDMTGAFYLNGAGWRLIDIKYFASATGRFDADKLNFLLKRSHKI